MFSTTLSRIVLNPSHVSGCMWATSFLAHKHTMPKPVEFSLWVVILIWWWLRCSRCWRQCPGWREPVTAISLASKLHHTCIIGSDWPGNSSSHWPTERMEGAEKSWEMLKQHRICWLNVAMHLIRMLLASSLYFYEIPYHTFCPVPMTDDFSTLISFFLVCQQSGFPISCNSPLHGA